MRPWFVFLEIFILHSFLSARVDLAKFEPELSQIYLSCQAAVQAHGIWQSGISSWFSKGLSS